MYYSVICRCHVFSWENVSYNIFRNFHFTVKQFQVLKSSGLSVFFQSIMFVTCSVLTLVESILVVPTSTQIHLKWTIMFFRPYVSLPCRKPHSEIVNKAIVDLFNVCVNVMYYLIAIVLTLSWILLDVLENLLAKFGYILTLLSGWTSVK